MKTPAVVTQEVCEGNLTIHSQYSLIFAHMHTKLQVGSDHVMDSGSPCGGCVVGQERGAVALSSEAVSGLVVAGDHGLGLSLGFALLWHGPVPLTPSLLQPASSQTPFLQVDPAQLVVYGWVVEKVQRQQHHDEEAVDPHANQGCIITAGETDWEY